MAVAAPLSEPRSTAGRANFARLSCKRTGWSFEAAVRNVMSNGGKTMATAASGVNGEGKAFTSTLVYDRQ
jgi:hypothetical protein